MNNLYELYQYNIWNLINNYNLKYYWLNISKEKFYNGIKEQDPSNWETLLNNPWLNIYKNNKLNLAKDILKNGMFTPIFYLMINNEKYIIIGKHRLYSLLLFDSITPITKKFLFIELPNKLNDIKLESNLELYFFYDEYKVNTINIKTLNNILTLLMF